MICSLFSSLLLGAIALSGVSGERLSAHASFDANNVRLGDPMLLTIDFVGTADFSSLHPPALAKEVDRTVWKVDDASAKTETYMTARRLVYRVRPLKEGLHTFPSLSFSYAGPAELGEVTVSTTPIPVHVKAGAQAALAGLEADQEGLPMPDGILVAVADRLSDEERFRWEKACRTPKAAAFAAFDFPEARMNEAACHILDGNWAKALRLYSGLEWRIGQTPSIERGMLAALARKHASAEVELPVWRTAFRPLLRHAWGGRLAWLSGCLAVLCALYCLGRKVIRAMACLAFVFCTVAANAQSIDPFAEMDRMMQESFNRMNSMMGLTVNGRPQPRIEVKASVRTDKTDLQVGDPFSFILSVETPRTSSLGQIRLLPSEMFGMIVLGAVENLTDGVSSNPSNVVRRMSVPVRYDVPFSGAMTFRVSGMVSGRQDAGSGRRRMNVTFSQSFDVETEPVQVNIRPLPTDGQPESFRGAIGSGFRLHQSVNRTRVETNDVVVVSCSLEYKGYVPPGAIDDELERRPGIVSWISYFVADGSPSVSDCSLTYYDTDKKAYRTVTAKGPALTYVPEVRESSEAVAVDDGGRTDGGRALKLRFAPSASAPVVASVPRPDSPVVTLEKLGAWVRVETGGHAGWIRQEDLK